MKTFTHGVSPTWKCRCDIHVDHHRYDEWDYVVNHRPVFVVEDNGNLMVVMHGGDVRISRTALQVESWTNVRETDVCPKCRWHRYQEVPNPWYDESYRSMRRSGG